MTISVFPFFFFFYLRMRRDYLLAAIDLYHFSSLLVSVFIYTLLFFSCIYVLSWITPWCIS